MPPPRVAGAAPPSASCAGRHRRPDARPQRIRVDARGTPWRFWPRPCCSRSRQSGWRSGPPIVIWQHGPARHRAGHRRNRPLGRWCWPIRLISPPCAVTRLPVAGRPLDRSRPSRRPSPPRPPRSRPAAWDRPCGSAARSANEADERRALPEPAAGDARSYGSTPPMTLVLKDRAEARGWRIDRGRRRR